MKKNKSNHLAKTRFLKAYYVTFKILSRYIILLLVSKFFDGERGIRIFERAHLKSARQIIATLLALKGLYIKLGQTLSAMTHVLPATFTKELELLQDQVPPHPFEEVNERFMADFGQPADKLFKTIDPEPIASASLGQVHVATHHNGAKLAVKLQYPNIDKLITRDLKTIKNIFSIIDFLFPSYNIRAVYDELSVVVLEELDYINEAKNIETIASNYKDQDNIVFPEVFHELTSHKVLTQSFIEGVKITHVEELSKYPVDTSQLAVDLIHFYCKQVFVDGIYHADPHPGNIVITPEGKIAMLDFGAVATVSPSMRQGMTMFVEGLIKKDSRALTQAIKMMGFIAKKDDEETLDRVVEYFYNKISGIKIDSFKNLDITQFQNLNDLIELKKMDINLADLTSLFVVPRDWIMLERTVVLMTGLTAELDEKLNPVEIVVPYVEKFLLGDDHKRLAEILLSTSKDIIISYINLPDDIRKLARKLRVDGLKVQNTDMKKELSGVRRSITMLATAFLACTSAVLSYLFYTDGLANQGFRFETGCYFFGALFILMLLRR
jgi:ubiquinone biosynthesis protein